MAGKARRAASRQGQLKRKKQTKGPSGIPSTAGRVPIPDSDETEDVPANLPKQAVDSEALSTARASGMPSMSQTDSPQTPPSTSVSHGHGRLRGERPAAYLYVGAEFRRILALTSAVLAALVVLGVVL